MDHRLHQPNATYDATTGLLVLYFGFAHGVTTADLLSLDDNSLTFSCGMDQYGTSKTYPRASDPIQGQNVNPTAVTITVLQLTLVHHL